MLCIHSQTAVRLCVVRVAVVVTDRVCGVGVGLYSAQRRPTTSWRKPAGLMPWGKRDAT